MTDKTNKVLARDAAIAEFAKRYDRIAFVDQIDVKDLFRIFDAGYDHAAAELRWIPVSERLPELGDCYMTTQDLEDGEGVMSWPLHYESKTKKWFQDIDHKEPFDHPVLAWQERPKPYTEPADNIGEEEGS